MAHEQASIRTLLGGLLKNRHLVASMRRVMVMSLWEKVVGQMVAQKSWPESVQDGVLTVGVTSHAWAAELQLLKADILSRYRQLLGRSAIKDVTFRVGRRRARPTDEQLGNVIALHPAPGEQIMPLPLPQEVFDGVSNPEVRDLLGPVFAKLRAQREWKQEHGWVRCPSCQRIYHGLQCPQCSSSSNFDAA